MTESQPIEQARETVKMLLDTLKILRVVCVDDVYYDEPPIEELVGAACSLDADTLRKLLPELEPIPEDLDVLRIRVQKVWGELEPTVRANRAKELFPETSDQIDSQAASDLASLIPEGMFLPVTQKKWVEQRERFLLEDSEQRTLFLFDHDLSKKGGEIDGGMRIISSLLARADANNLICGLLTHTVSPENRGEKWNEFSSTYGIATRDRFLVIPKRYLSEDQMLFAQSLKEVALAPDFTELKRKAQKILEEAAAKAAERVEAISLSDLEHMVFKVSDEEGMWEPDMLFRLHSLFHRTGSRQLAVAGGELEKIANRLRSVSQIPATANRRFPSSTWLIQREELFEPGDYLNENHLPLELGDIFAKTDGTAEKYYILLAPSCDLMVRSNGRRTPEIEYVPLAEIIAVSSGYVPNRVEERIEYFGKTPGTNWIVKLKRIHQVRACLLDLCVFNSDGKATILSGRDAPSALWPAWKKRHDVVTRSVKQQLHRLDGLQPKQSEHLLREGPFKGNLLKQGEQQGIEFNCRRVERLTRVRAYGLLMAYTSCLSRPAYDRDFGIAEAINLADD